MDDDDVFMTLNLPLEPTGSRTASEGSGSHSTLPFWPPQTNPACLPIHKTFPGNNSPAASCRGPFSKSPSPPQPKHQPHNIHIISYDTRTHQPHHHHPSTTNTDTTDPSCAEQPTSIAPGDNYSYVQLTAVHDFSSSYASPPPPHAPSSCIDDTAGVHLSSGLLGSLKKRGAIEAMGGGGDGGGCIGGLGVGGRQMNKKEAVKMKLRLRCRFVA